MISRWKFLLQNSEDSLLGTQPDSTSSVKQEWLIKMAIIIIIIIIWLN